MCRHLGYLGPAVPLAALVHDPPHSLERQSYAPADMRGGGTVNADGYGVGWYPAPGGPAVRYRRAGAIWSDENLARLSRVVVSGAVLAAVRSATVGMPVVDTACAPFTDGGGCSATTAASRTGRGPWRTSRGRCRPRRC